MSIRSLTSFLDQNPPPMVRNSYWNDYIDIPNPYKKLVFSNKFLEEIKEDKPDINKFNIYIPLKEKFQIPKRKISDWFPNSWLKIEDEYYPIFVRELDNFYSLRKTLPLTQNAIREITRTYRSSVPLTQNAIQGVIGRKSSASKKTKQFQPDLYTIDEQDEYLTMPLYSKLKTQEKKLIQATQQIKMIKKGKSVTNLELKNNVKILVVLYKNESSSIYKLSFSYKEKKENDEFLSNIPTVEFYINNNDILIIKKVESKLERQMGWCGVMISFLMELMNHWILTENITIKGVGLTNASLREGNIAGTICYIKYIGKYYPFFQHGNEKTVYYLNPYMDMKLVKWKDILRNLGLGEVLETGQDTFFSFWKKSPELLIKTPSRKSTYRK